MIYPLEKRRDDLRSAIYPTAFGRSPSGSGSRASHEAAKASSPDASIPNADGMTRAQRLALASKVQAELLRTRIEMLERLDRV
jgi:hypothetical protein